MKLPDFILRFIGRKIANELKLEETMDDTKKWYQSKGIWTGVITALVGLYLTLGKQFNWPAIPDWIFTILGTIGVYSRATATDKIV